MKGKKALPGFDPRPKEDLQGGSNGDFDPEKLATKVQESDTVAEERNAIAECIGEIDRAHSKLKELKKNFSPDSASYQACEQIEGHLTAASSQFNP